MCGGKGGTGGWDNGVEAALRDLRLIMERERNRPGGRPSLGLDFECSR
jgi:hypothetical protein